MMQRHRLLVLLQYHVLLLLAAPVQAERALAAAEDATPVFRLHTALDAPVIDSALAHAQPGGGGPNSGFEGGLYFRTSDGRYHLFPSECMLDRPKVPWDIHMESHDWSSADGVHNWTRGALIYNSSAAMDGSDRRGAIWAPMPVWDPDSNRFHLFYVGYTCDPGQVDGAIYHLVSQTEGPGGVAGPYPPENGTVILDLEGAGGWSAHWEGSAKDQGDDSFFPWRLDNGTWVGFFGVPPPRNHFRRQ